MVFYLQASYSTSDRKSEKQGGKKCAIPHLFVFIRGKITSPLLYSTFRLFYYGAEVGHNENIPEWINGARMLNLNVFLKTQLNQKHKRLSMGYSQKGVVLLWEPGRYNPSPECPEKTWSQGLFLNLWMFTLLSLVLFQACNPFLLFCFSVFKWNYLSCLSCQCILAAYNLFVTDSKLELNLPQNESDLYYH